MSKNNVRYHYAKQETFIKLMHMAASVRETRTVTNNFPAWPIQH